MKEITENQLHDFLINSRHSCKKHCLHNSKICFSSLDVSECSYREFLQCTINNALFELLFVMLNQKLDFSFFESFTCNKNDVFALSTSFNSH